MVYTVTLNPAIDYIVSPAKFSAGEINRYQKAVYGPGGKGANVSLLLSSLGVRNRALGICAGFSGGEIVRLLEERGCETDFVRMPQGHSRINVKVCAPDGEETDLNGDGPDTPPEAVEELLQKLDGLGEGDTLVLAGSIPRSVPGDIYAAMLRRLEGRGVLAVVDATGEALRCILPCRPFLVKPNSDELGELFGVEIPDVGTAKEYAKLLVREGARNVVVSMGDKGALLVGETGQSLFCRAVRGEAVSTVGAGDSLVAGFLYGYGLHGTLQGALQWGVAAGAATAFSKGIASGDAVKALYPRAGNPSPI